MMINDCGCGVARVKGLERIKFKLSYNSTLLNVWTGNAAVLAGLTHSADNTSPPSLGISYSLLPVTCSYVSQYCSNNNSSTNNSDDFTQISN